MSCSGFVDLAKKERHYIESIGCVNKMIPGRKIQEWSKQYYEINKETHNAYSKQYYKINKEIHTAYSKQYAQDNKVEIKARKSVKVKCQHCGCEVQKGSLPRHQRTMKCQSTTNLLLETNN